MEKTKILQIEEQETPKKAKGNIPESLLAEHIGDYRKGFQVHFAGRDHDDDDEDFVKFASILDQAILAKTSSH